MTKTTTKITTQNKPSDDRGNDKVNNDEETLLNVTDRRINLLDVTISQ